jgi:hypothetical protein
MSLSDKIKSYGTQKILIIIILIVSLVLMLVAMGLNIHYYNKVSDAVIDSNENTDILKNIVKNY